MRSLVLPFALLAVAAAAWWSSLNPTPKPAGEAPTAPGWVRRPAPAALESPAVHLAADGSLLCLGLLARPSVETASRSDGDKTIVLLEFAPGGDLVMRSELGLARRLSTRPLAVDAHGDVFVAIASPAARTHLAIAEPNLLKFGRRSRRVLWTKALQGSFPKAITASDFADGVVVAGWFGGVLELPGPTIKAAGAKDVVLARFDSEGRTVWVQTFGGAPYDHPPESDFERSDPYSRDADDVEDVASLPDGGVGVLMRFRARLSVGTDTFSADTPSTLLAALRGDGVPQWAIALGPSNGVLSRLAVSNTSILVLSPQLHREGTYLNGFLLRSFSNDGSEAWRRRIDLENWRLHGGPSLLAASDAAIYVATPFGSTERMLGRAPVGREDRPGVHVAELSPHGALNTSRPEEPPPSGLPVALDVRGDRMAVATCTRTASLVPCETHVAVRAMVAP